MIPKDQLSALLLRANELKHQAKYKEAIALLEDILLSDPTSVVALEEIADNEMSLGNHDRAKRAAESALSLSKESCGGHYVLGFLASHESRFDASVQHLQAANRLDPNNAEILRCLGWSLFSSDRDVEGIVTLERALNLEPDNSLILCDLGVVCLQCHQFQKSISLLKRALAIDPSNERAQECLQMAQKISATMMQRDA